MRHDRIRREPFTTLAIRLQGGFFDHADRLFHAIGTTYAPHPLPYLPFNHLPAIACLRSNS